MTIKYLKINSLLIVSITCMLCVFDSFASGQKSNNLLTEKIKFLNKKANNGNRENVIGTLRELVIEHPNNSEINYWLGYHLERKSLNATDLSINKLLTEEAAKYIGKSISVNSSSTDRRLYYAMILTEIGKHENAVENYKVVFSKYDASNYAKNILILDGISQYIDSLIALGRIDDALKEVKLWVDKSEWNYIVVSKYIYVSGLTDIENANRIAKHYIEKHGFSDYILEALCTLEYESKYYKKALECFNKLSSNPKTSKTFKNYGLQMQRTIKNK